MSNTTPRPKPPGSKPPPWYRVPFVWFVIGLLLATLAAAAHMIVISLDADDPSVLESGHERVFKVPVAPPKPAENPSDKNNAPEAPP